MYLLFTGLHPAGDYQNPRLFIIYIYSIKRNLKKIPHSQGDAG
ncbi:protein of unknown function [Escherichia coli]|nr:protein of unknown function [Escherichia coli]